MLSRKYLNRVPALRNWETVHEIIWISGFSLASLDLFTKSMGPTWLSPFSGGQFGSSLNPPFCYLSSVFILRLRSTPALHFDVFIVKTTMWGMCLRTSLLQFGESRPALWCLPSPPPPTHTPFPTVGQYSGT